MNVKMDRYESLELRVCKIFGEFSELLSEDARNNVEHYIDVAEIEMAYESLVLSLIDEKIVVSDILRKELLEIGVLLGLDKDSVFRADFWELVNGKFG